MTGTYLYAVTSGDCHSELGRVGLPDGWARVVAVRRAGLAAIVGRYHGPSLDQLPRAALLRSLAIHQQVVERAMADRPVLPAKFGTILASNDEVALALDRWHCRLASALAELGDVVEVEVAATWDLRQTFAEIGRHPRIGALAASMVGRPDDETVTVRLEIGKLVKAELDRRREEYRQQVVRELASFARDAQANPLPSDELVLNVAFLIERTRLDAFYARVHELDRSLQNRLTFRCIGPLPPYSFGTIEIARPRSDEIDAARRLLGLGQQVSETEITASYRRLATRCHPDRNPEDPSAAGRFAALAAAHARLLSYLHGQRTTEGPMETDRQCDLAPAAVQAALLLSVKGPQSQPIPFARAS